MPLECKEEIKVILENEDTIADVEMILEEMLKFLGELPVDEFHDYSDFRHKGLRDHLINRFLREKWNTELCVRK